MIAVKDSWMAMAIICQILLTEMLILVGKIDLIQGRELLKEVQISNN